MENHGPYDRLVIKTISVHFSLTTTNFASEQTNTASDIAGTFFRRFKQRILQYTKNFKTSQSGYKSPSEHKGKFTPENEVMRPKQERQKKWWHFFREL